jgi:hypothetical protein
MLQFSGHFRCFFCGFTLLACSLLCSNAAAQTCVAPPENMIAWWPLDESADSPTGADIAGSNTGTVVAATLGVPGMVERAASFNGVDSFIISSAPNQVLLQYTVDLWVKASALGQIGFTGVFNNFNNVGVGGTSDSIQIDLDGGNPGNYRVVFFSPGVDPIIFGPVTAEWQHLAVTYDGETVRAYLNSEFKDSLALAPADAGTNFRDFVLGRNRAANLYFNGLIDEVEVFDRALSEEEIASIFAAGSAGKCKTKSVNIDIQPRSINPKNNELIRVAILSTAGFNATDVDPSSVQFGRRGAKEVHSRGHIDDVNGDGLPDLILYFRAQETGILCGDTTATLTGETFAGHTVEGTDFIQTVGCPKPPKPKK